MNTDNNRYDIWTVAGYQGQQIAPSSREAVRLFVDSLGEIENYQLWNIPVDDIMKVSEHIDSKGVVKVRKTIKPGAHEYRYYFCILSKHVH